MEVADDISPCDLRYCFKMVSEERHGDADEYRSDAFGAQKVRCGQRKC